MGRRIDAPRAAALGAARSLLRPEGGDYAADEWEWGDDAQV